MEMLQDSVEHYKPVQQIIKKQKDDGIWGANLLATEAGKKFGAKEAGTIATYRKLLEMGVSNDSRPFRMANRPLFRVLSRDPDPDLLFEYKKAAKKNPALADWAKNILREGAVATLLHAGLESDPRVRGAAKRMANQVSAFLRSDAADNPLTQSGNKHELHHDIYPPTLFTFVMAAYLSDFRRERAGLLDRLMKFVGRPRPDVNYDISVGDIRIKPTYQLLGDPLDLDADGYPTDIPFALQWIELLARAGCLENSPTAKMALASLLSDCDDEGVWNPKGLRGIPKSQNTLSDFAFPLEIDSKDQERRKTDVTFRLSLIAKTLGCDLEIL